LGVGSYFGIRAISKNSDAESHCPTASNCGDAEGPKLTSQAKNAAVAANITIGVGAAFVVAGVVLYLTSEPKREARLELHPIVSRDVAGIGFGGAFR
jgi:serine/threonine-protein kinase